MAVSLQERDKKVIWHPYTPQKYGGYPIPIVSGEGAWLTDDKGNRYIDAISSWWVNVHGHANAYIAEKIYQQALKLEQVIFAGFTHEPAIALAERLITKLPGQFSRIFYSDNGSTATEVAIKMALQYWRNRGIPRTGILALSNSYHGDTFGAMSISERGIFTDAFRDLLFDVKFARVPVAGVPLSVEGLSENELPSFLDQCACLIYEPLVQGAGGMKMYEARALDELLQVCRRHGIICIADEVMTGFGRTGKLFASEYCTIKPDIICLSKGITGGTMALGVTACTAEIHSAFVHDDKLKTFFHGHSYTANPLACTAALASLDIFDQPGTVQNIVRIGERHTAFASQLRMKADGLRIKNIRQTGTILAFEITSEVQGYTSGIKEVIISKCLERNILVRPLGNTVYLMPPYCISDEELKIVYEGLEEVLGLIG